MVGKTDNFFFVKSIDDISKNDWNDCVGLDHPFTRYEFFQALEKSKSAVNTTGWQPFHYIQINKKNGYKKIPEAKEKSLTLKN